MSTQSPAKEFFLVFGFEFVAEVGIINSRFDDMREGVGEIVLYQTVTQ